MDTYAEIVRSIIKSQMAIIGPMAVEEANKINGLSIDSKLENIAVTSTPPEDAVKRLVEQYASLFGAISIEVSKEAINAVIKNKTEQVNLPTFLQ